MRIVYIANDGTQFSDEYECMDYEWKLSHPYLNDVHFYDKNGIELRNACSESTYSSAEKITVPSDEAAKDMRELASYTGFCCYGDVTRAGVVVEYRHV